MVVNVMNKVISSDFMSKNDTKVSLIKLGLEHSVEFFEWASDEEVVRWMMWERYNRIEDVEIFIRDVVEKHPWFMGISVNNKIVGSITLDRGKGPNRCKVELGYVLAKSHWGKGVATQAVIEALREAFHDPIITRVEAYVDPQNIASQRVLEKAGFLKEGLIRRCTIQKDEVKDRFLYSFVR